MRSIRPLSSPHARREILHSFLRETTDWYVALRAVVDSVHHGIALAPETVVKTLDVIDHHSESIDPALYLMKYFKRYTEDPKNRLTQSNLHAATNRDDGGGSGQTAQDKNYEFLCHRFLQLCVRHKNGWAEALSIFSLTDTSTVLNDKCTKLLVDLCRICGQWQQSCLIFHTIKPNSANCSPELLAAALHAFAVAKKWQEALVLFSTVAKTDKRIIPESYDRLIHACYRASQYDQVNRLLNRILKIGIVPHETTVRMCLHSAEEEGQWTSALCLLRSLQRNNLQVTMLMYEEVIRAALCNNILSPNHVDCAWQIALDLMQEMKTVFGSIPSPYLQELMFAALIRRKQTTAEASYKLFRQAEKTHAIKRNSRVVINAMLEKAFYEKSWGVFFALKHRLYNCSPKRSACEANLIIGATALTGHWWGAIAILLRYKQAGMPYLCPTNKQLLLSCAEKIHDRSLMGALRQELDGKFNFNPLRRISIDAMASEAANIDYLLRHALATSE